MGRHRRIYRVLGAASSLLVTASLLLLLSVIVVGYGTADDVMPMEWEDGPSSWTEFGHDNDDSLCGLRSLTLDKWEGGRHWLGNVPVLVSGVTDGWKALYNWK